TSAAALGNVESLKALLDARGKANGPPGAISAEMKQVPPDSQIWGAYVGGHASLPFNLQGNMANLDRMAQSVDTALIYFDLRDGVKGLAHFNTGGSKQPDADAKQLGDALKGLIGLGRLAVRQDQKDLIILLDGLHVTQDEKSVSLKIEE